MALHRSTLAVVLGALLLFPWASGSLTAQTDDHARARTLLDGLRTRVPEVAREIGWLQNALPRAGTIPPDVLQDLQDLHDGTIAADKLSQDDRQRFLDLARREITVKAEYCRKHPQGMAALVDVTVHTWQPGTEPRVEAKQWNVMYLSAPMAVFPIARESPFRDSARRRTAPCRPAPTSCGRKIRQIRRAAVHVKRFRSAIPRNRSMLASSLTS